MHDETRKGQMPPIRLRRDIKIPMRDGISLAATLYLPASDAPAAPVIFTLTPYIGQTYHDQGVYFAGRGYPFVTVDVRGRGDSEGTFDPYINEGADGADVVAWLSRQSYCNGKVAMWGGSYGGYDQWRTAAMCPPGLATIVPVASPFFGVDFPIRANVASPYWVQWLSLVSGRTSQDRIFSDAFYWNQQFKHWYESGIAFKDLDTAVGSPSRLFQEWAAHPERGEYWDRYNPTCEQYRDIEAPVLTITGIYDGDQLGALMHYAQHLKSVGAGGSRCHYLIIGPWDHAGTRNPQLEFAGIKVGKESVLDLRDLHVQWYDWTMRTGSRPDFLARSVAYYVMVADRWRYADSLEEITARVERLFLSSVTNPVDIFRSGSLESAELPSSGTPDQYLYDPRDVSKAERESALDQARWVITHHLLYQSNDVCLFYHSESFSQDVEIGGFFKLSLWLSIDTPDTDVSASIYEVAEDGSVTLLATDVVRARYRESLRECRLIGTTDPLRYDFDRFTFVARLIRRGCRLRLTIAPVNSMYAQKNYNSGKPVAEECMADARSVTVRLFHDESHPSALQVPYGKS